MLLFDEHSVPREKIYLPVGVERKRFDHVQTTHMNKELWYVTNIWLRQSGIYVYVSPLPLCHP